MTTYFVIRHTDPARDTFLDHRGRLAGLEEETGA